MVFHLAAETGTAQSMYEVEMYHKTNIEATTKLLQFYLKFPDYVPNKIILSSSRAVYGEGCHGSVETDCINPLSVYGATKAYQEQLFRILLTGKIDFSILRLQNVYGPHTSLVNPYVGVLNVFPNRMLYDEDVFIYEDGLMKRDFVFIDDVVNAFILAMQTDVKYDTFNIGSGVPVTILELANGLLQLLDSKSKIIITGKKRQGDVKCNFADLTKSS
jgi:dTDP-L-rhamnose 4-epimerase